MRRNCRAGSGSAWALAVSLAILILSGSGIARGDEDLATDDDAAIRELLAAQAEAWNEGDLEGFMQAYEPSDALLFASGNQLTYGWRTTLERYQRRYDTPEKMGQLAFEVLQVDLLGSQHAKLLGRWRLIREEDSPHGLFTLILARHEGSWRIIHDHTSAASE